MDCQVLCTLGCFLLELRHGYFRCGTVANILPDHTFRNVTCKHIHAVLFSKLLRKKVYQDTFPTPINQSIIQAMQLGRIVCQHCGSENYKKHGKRDNKHADDVQRYYCKDCKRNFIVNPAFEGAKESVRVITAAIDLYFKGVSLRKASDHIKQLYGG